jgi:cytoskeleton protein RodZ
MSTQPVPPPAVPSPSRAIVSVDNGLLGLTFSERSWVQVVDATGKAVLDRTFNAGESQEVAGRAPFTVVIGNAQATRIAFNGKEVDLAPHTRASVARLTVK